MATKTNKCTFCKARFPTDIMTSTPAGRFCTHEHAIAYAQAYRDKAMAKQRKAKTKADKDRLKTRAQWLKEAQAEFNRFVRLRDAGEPCISCQRHHAGQYHAGHYRSVGAHPELRFNENNCHKQCAPCNNHLSGNIVDYRINLIKKIGLEAVEDIEGPHENIKISVFEIKEIKAKYKTKANEQAKVAEN